MNCNGHHKQGDSQRAKRPDCCGEMMEKMMRMCGPGQSAGQDCGEVMSRMMARCGLGPDQEQAPEEEEETTRHGGGSGGGGMTAGGGTFYSFPAQTLRAASVLF
jgi:hypothetical protein